MVNGPHLHQEPAESVFDNCLLHWQFFFSSVKAASIAWIISRRNDQLKGNDQIMQVFRFYILTLIW